MEMVILAVVVLFVVGKWWLSKLQQNVSPDEAKFIEKKYWGWIPISIFFLLIIYSPRLISVLIYSIFVFWGYIQVFKSLPTNKKINIYTSSGIVIMFLSSLSFLVSDIGKQLLILVVFGSVFSDLTSYSVSKLSDKKHPLPKNINHNKTWEGVTGGIMGSLLAIPVFYIAGGDIKNLVVWKAILLIGIASVTGDILNSFIKRKLEIKDWGKTFPSHGGIWDRFSSFYFSYLFILLISI